MASVTGKQAAFVPAAAPLASTACGGNASPDFGASFNLRVVTFFVVLTCSSLGIVLPLVLRFRQSLAGISRSSWLFLAKAFGAGVILAVGIIHVFPDASTALGDPCLGARQGTAGTFPVYWCSRQHAFCYGQPLRLSHRAPPFVYARVLCGLIGYICTGTIMLDHCACMPSSTGGKSSLRLLSAGWQNYPWAALGVLMLEGCIQAFYERAHTAAAATDAPADVEAKGSAAMLGSPLGTQTDGIAAHPHGGHALDLAVKEDKIRLLTIAQVCPAPAAAPAHCACCAVRRTQAQRTWRVLAPQMHGCACELTDRPPAHAGAGSRHRGPLGAPRARTSTDPPHRPACPVPLRSSLLLQPVLVAALAWTCVTDCLRGAAGC